MENNVVIVKNELLTEVENKSFDVVNTLNSLSLITPSDIKQLESAQSFLVSTYTDVPEFRPLIVKLASVLNDGQFPTPDSKYWQCKKEAEVHFKQLVSEILKYERSLVDIEEMDYLINNTEYKDDRSKFDLKRLYLKKKEYEFNLKQLEKSIKYRISEVTEWAAIAKNLETSCEYDMKNYQEHIVKSLYLKLQSEIDRNKNDSSAVANFSSQLNTLKSIIDAVHKN